MTLTAAATRTARHARGLQAVDSLRVLADAAARVQSWAATTEGDRRTGRVLQSLDRDAWHVQQRIGLSGGGRADHLAIGPSGVYMLVSMAWRGVVTVDHKGATITPEGRPGAAWTARGQHCSLAPAAAALGRSVAMAAASPLPAPRAVVVIWGAFPERLAVSGAITYVAGDHLAEWLTSQPRRLDPGVVPRSPRESLANSPRGLERSAAQLGPTRADRRPGPLPSGGAAIRIVTSTPCSDDTRAAPR